jgi:hypothetical protein
MARPPAGVTVQDRFAMQAIPKESGCVEWSGWKNQYGYGCFHVDGRDILVHRWAYADKHGPIPNGLFACHRCDNPSCVNPDHIFLGTQKDNLQDAGRKGRMNKTIKARGEKHGNATLKNDQVRDMRRLYDKGVPTKDIAAQFGCRYSHVYAVVTKITYKSVI